jgi:hypothetical protein
MTPESVELKIAFAIPINKSLVAKDMNQDKFGYDEKGENIYIQPIDSRIAVYSMRGWGPHTYKIYNSQEDLLKDFKISDVVTYNEFKMIEIQTKKS